MRRPLPGGVRLPKTGPARIALAMLVLAGALFVVSPTAQAQTDAKKVLLYTGSMALPSCRCDHARARRCSRARSRAQGFTVDWKDCNGNGCYSPENNPAIFTPANLAQYDVIFFSNASGAQNFTAERAGGDHRFRPEGRRDRRQPRRAPTWGRRR